MVKYKDYELPYELHDRLLVLNENSFIRSLDYIKELNSDLSIPDVKFKKFDISETDYIIEDFEVLSLKSVKVFALDVYNKRYRTIGRRKINQVKDPSGYVINEVNDFSELTYITWGDASLLNRNSVVIVRLMDDISTDRQILLPEGSSFVLDLNGHTLTVDYDYLFGLFRNCGIISVFGGTIKMEGDSNFSFLYTGHLPSFDSAGSVSSMSGLYFYDVLGVSSASDKKLYFDLNNEAISDFKIYTKNCQIKVFMPSNKVEFINVHGSTNISISNSNTESCNVNVLNDWGGLALGMIQNSFRRNVEISTPDSIPHNILFTL